MKNKSLLGCVVLWLLIDAAWATDIQQVTRGHSDCASCHVSHNGTVGQALLPVSFVDDLCLQCHRGQTEVANGPTQIGEWNNRGSSHISGVEVRMRGTFRRTVEFGGTRAAMENTCVGCHDPHGRQPKKLKEVRFDSQGEPTGSKASLTADVCFGCHAGPEATRLAHFRSKSNDTGTFFGPGTVSTHRLGPLSSQRPDLPSLSAQHEEPMDCTSCHGNSDRYGPKGPHTSAYPALLKAPYTSESDINFIGEPTQNHLCYICHRKESIESNQSFPFHREHVLGFFVNWPKTEGKTENRTLQDGFPRAQWSAGRRIVPTPGLGQPTPCATCHDPHGSLEYPALIQFDPQVVMPSSVGGPYFRGTSPQHGACTLFCHGYDHVQTRY